MKIDTNLSDEDFKNFYHKKLKGGYPAGELYNDLLESGYTKGRIEDLINQHYQEVETSTKQRVKTNSLLLIILLSILVIYFLVTKHAIALGAVGFIIFFYASYKYATKKNDGE
ncbi:MAG: hypothetical protein V4556_06060 [Bacteroidota bacterium]